MRSQLFVEFNLRMDERVILRTAYNNPSICYTLLDREDGVVERTYFFYGTRQFLQALTYPFIKHAMVLVRLMSSLEITMLIV